MPEVSPLALDILPTPAVFDLFFGAGAAGLCLRKDSVRGRQRLHQRRRSDYGLADLDPFGTAEGEIAETDLRESSRNHRRSGQGRAGVGKNMLSLLGQ